MATKQIDYGKLRDAAKRGRKVADELEDYAGALPGGVINPLGNLEGGHSGNTSSAATLAQQKARDLKDRATRYRNMAREIENFASKAEQADERVARRIARISRQRYNELGTMEKVSVALGVVYDATIGQLPGGKTLQNIHNICSTGRERLKSAIKHTFDWFKHGNGRYVLEVLGKIVAVVGAAFTLFKWIAAVVASFPVGIIIGAIMIGIAALVLAKNIADLSVTTKESLEAGRLNDTEPGLARYHGSTTSLSSYATKMTTSRNFQKGAAIFDTAAAVGEIALIFGGLGLSSSSGKTTISFKKDTVIKNLAGKFGLKPKADGSFSLKKGGFRFRPFGTYDTVKDATTGKTYLKLDTVFGIKTGPIDMTGNTAIIEAAERIHNPLSSGLGTITYFTRLGETSGSKATFEFLGQLKNITPGLSGLGDISKIGKTVITIKNIELPKASVTGGGSW